MRTEDLQRNALGVSRGVAMDMEADGSGATRAYILECVRRFFRGDFGTIPPEDAAANLDELEAGEGHALAHYPARHALRSDIYINAYSSAEDPGDADRNNTLVMYCDEY